MNERSGIPYSHFNAPPARAQSTSAFKWVVGLTTALIALLLGLITLLLIGFSTGLVPFLIGLVVAILPAPIYVMLALWIDRFEAEPKWLLATSFLWGALVAVGISIIVNSLGIEIVNAFYGKEAADLYGLSFSAPVVEESAKALGLFVLYFWKRDEFDGILDGIVYASMVGLGFAMTENIKYYAESVADGSAFGTFVVRGMFSPYAHPLFTSMTGIGLGIASHARSRAVKFFMPLVGFALAIVLHSVWNTSLFFSQQLENGLLALVMYFLIMVPIFAGVLLVALFALRREGLILRQYLAGEVERGFFARDEYERLCRVSGRFSASCKALFGRGFSSWRAHAHFHSAASELAFHRHRVARGVATGGANATQREAAYLQTLYELRERLGR